MNVSDVIDDDYKEIQLVGGAVRVGHNPRAVRVAPDGKSVFVFDSLDFQIRRLDATTMRVSGTVKVSKPAKSDAWIRGKVLFSTARTPMSGRLWVACASCHPDGQPDGRIWHNPEGMRKTPSLSGLAHTHPLHFSADRDESQDFEFTIRSRLMQGSGLIPGRLPSKVPFKPTELEVTTSGKSPDLDALALYTNSFNFTLSPHIEGPGKLSTEAERGRILFNDNKVGCATCHSGPYYSDSSLQKPFKLHDVGTGKDDPSEKIGPTYDTPTLLGVYKTAPYLHHGKAATLLDVLTTANKDNRHGNTSQLAPGELNDLVAFMKSLPFEQPPLKTPNTVSFVEPVR
jgi:cytochrome c peroxidase